MKINALQYLGMGLMGWAAAPTPEDPLLYGAGVAPGVIKDGLLFAVGLGTFVLGTVKK